MKQYIALLLLFILACTYLQPPQSPEDKLLGSTENDSAENEDTSKQEEQNVSEEFKLILKAEKQGNTVKLTWNKYDEEMIYYKVVRSTTDATPTYYEEGYIETISDPNTLTYTDAKSEVGVNYYAISIVLPYNKYIDSNPVKIEFPDPTETPDQDIEIFAEQVDDIIKLTWTRYDGNFYQYKVMRSTTNPFPKYPNDDLIKTIPYVDETIYTDRRAEQGINYYAVTIIRPDKSKFTSSATSITLI